jgi:predicted nucleic-acid-binding Zn-ribbon protein
MSEKQTPTCPLCGNQQFKREEGRMDSKWGVTSHKIILLICTRCQHILQFYNKRSIFDFD